MRRLNTCFLFGLVGVLVLPPAVVAQNNRPQRPPQAPVTPAETPRTGTQHLLGQANEQLAYLALARASTPAEKLPALDLRMDLLILARLSLLSVLETADYSDEQAIYFLRGKILLRAAAYAETYTGAGTPQLTAFHERTFKLKSPTSPAEADAQSRDAAVALLSVLPLRGFDAKPLRPPFVAERPTTRQAGEPAAAASPQELAARVRAIAVSADLRRQLILLAERTAAAAAAVPPDPSEVAALRTALDTSVRVAEGLATNLAVSPVDRERLERELALAVALTLDPRLRSSAEFRFRVIEPYARLLARVGKMNLSPDQRAAFEPVIAFSRTHANGPAALAAIEDYLKLTADFDTLFPPSFQPPAQPTAQRTAAEQALKQFGVHRAAFIAAAARISAVTDLTNPLGEMQHHASTLNLLQRLPGALDTLSPVSTRPPTALPRRVAVSLGVVADAQPSPERAAARQFFADLVALAEAQASAGKPLFADIPEQVVARFAAPPERIEAKRRDLIAEQLQLLASNSPPDRGKLARLARLPELASAVATAAELVASTQTLDPRPPPPGADNRMTHATFAGAEVLGGRWVDLQLPPGVLARLTDALAESLRPCAAGFLDDSAEAFNSLPSVSTRLQRTSQYFKMLLARSERIPVPTPADPDDPVILLQQLLTPFHQAPYATERFLSLTLSTLPPPSTSHPHISPLILYPLLDRVLP